MAASGLFVGQLRTRLSGDMHQSDLINKAKEEAARANSFVSYVAHDMESPGSRVGIWGKRAQFRGMHFVFAGIYVAGPRKDNKLWPTALLQLFNGCRQCRRPLAHMLNAHKRAKR